MAGPESIISKYYWYAVVPLIVVLIGGVTVEIIKIKYLSQQERAVVRAEPKIEPKVEPKIEPKKEIVAVAPPSAPPAVPVTPITPSQSPHPSALSTTSAPIHGVLTSSSPVPPAPPAPAPTSQPSNLVGWVARVGSASNPSIPAHARLWYVPMSADKLVERAYSYTPDGRVFEFSVTGKFNNPGTFVGKASLVKGPTGYSPDRIRITFSSNGSADITVTTDSKTELTGYLFPCNNTETFNTLSKCAGKISEAGLTFFEKLFGTNDIR
jgi:hypothetical protein